MTEAEYFAAPGLSQSDMKDLAVSPLRYWHKHLNPARPVDEPTGEMRLGSALHCAMLRPKDFDKEYACELIAPDYCLDTIDQLRQFIRDKGDVPKGTRKDDVIAQVLMIDPSAPVLQVLTQRHAEKHDGKVIFKRDDWLRIAGMAAALADEPHVQRLMAEGSAEVPIFVKDPDTGVQLKAKVDWWRDDCTVDFKTITVRDGQTVDQSVAREILYRMYYRQAYFYCLMRGWPDFRGEFIMPFVESDPPHEVRIRSLSPGSNNGNLYWQRAALEVRALVRTYAECMEHFGPDKPWRYAQDVRPLEDAEMPGMGW